MTPFILGVHHSRLDASLQKRDAKPLGTTPKKRRRRLVSIDPGSAREAFLRRRGFWAGWGGIATTVIVAMCVIALLVGWVLLWVFRDDGVNVALLTVGCVAFTLVLIVLAILQNRLIAHARLEQAEAAFLAGISHNLRTPISAIRAAAQALKRTDLATTQRENLLESVIHQTRRLALRVDNVLETGRLEVEHEAFEEKLIDLTSVIRSQLDELNPLLSARGGGLDADLEDAISVEGDVRALRLLFDNLFDNALKYAVETPLLRVTLTSEGGFGVVRVVDSGLGFEPDEAERLFRRFGRGDTGRGGIGLGLPLARAIARGHGGDVKLFSAGRGTGTQAEVWLPCAKEQR